MLIIPTVVVAMAVKIRRIGDCIYVIIINAVAVIVSVGIVIGRKTALTNCLMDICAIRFISGSLSNEVSNSIPT